MCFLFNESSTLAIFSTKYIHFSLFKKFLFQYNISVHSQVPFTTIPLKLAVPHVRTVASGLRHSAVVTRDGRVLVCGNGKNGQLGLTDRNGIPVVEVEQAQEGMKNIKI
jgi:alpha-tubulin suppressor-like RCC1 family protein